jgi:hypothetical protein
VDFGEFTNSRIWVSDHRRSVRLRGRRRRGPGLRTRSSGLLREYTILSTDNTKLVLFFLFIILAMVYFRSIKYFSSEFHIYLSFLWCHEVLINFLLFIFKLFIFSAINLILAYIASNCKYIDV